MRSDFLKATMGEVAKYISRFREAVSATTLNATTGLTSGQTKTSTGVAMDLLDSNFHFGIKAVVAAEKSPRLTMTLQSSRDNTNWTDVYDAGGIVQKVWDPTTAATTYYSWAVSNIYAPYLRLSIAISVDDMGTGSSLVVYSDTRRT